MKKALKWTFLIIALLILLAAIGLYLSATKLEEGYQASASAKRINDVHKITTLIEAYKQADGHYPFYDPSTTPEGFIKAPTMVIIGTPEAEAAISKKPNVFGITVNEASSSLLISMINNTLKREITLPVDPQKVPTGAPNAYYVFFFSNDDYVAITFLYEPSRYTTPLAPHVNAYALSSSPSIRFLKGINLKLNYIGNFDRAYLENVKTKGIQADGKFSNYTAISTDTKKAP